MSSFCHRWVLNLDTDQAESEGDDPSGVIDWFEILSISFSISNDAASGLRWDSEPDQIEDEVGYAHVYGVSVKDKLTIVRSGCWPLHEGVSHIGNTNPNTANKIKKQIDSLSGGSDLIVQLFVQNDFSVWVIVCLLELSLLIDCDSLSEVRYSALIIDFRSKVVRVSHLFYTYLIIVLTNTILIF